MLSDIPEPWKAFLEELDHEISRDAAFEGTSVELHCTGGFVVSMLYGLARPTNDLDIVYVEPFALIRPLLALGGQNSQLAEKHGVYLDASARVAPLPCDYKDRLVEMYPGGFTRMKLFAPDPYDLALSKLERNADRDI